MWALLKQVLSKLYASFKQLYSTTWYVTVLVLKTGLKLA